MFSYSFLKTLWRSRLPALPFFLFASFALAGCTGVPDSVEPVSPFTLKRYLGEWHEVARMDHRFERGLTRVTAEYSMREDGGVRVINRGYNAEKGEWNEAEGRAYFVGEPNVGRLKVSFFGPFYGAYNIAKLEPDYSMALVVGPNFDYLWILAREPNPAPEQCQTYADYAASLGADISALIWLSDCLP